MAEVAANSSFWTRRRVNLAGFLACAAMMGYALYAQHFLGLLPCNMCMLQRGGVIALGLGFLLAATHDPAAAGARVYAVVIALLAACAAAVSARHVWMQMQPAGSLPSCGADFFTMLDMFSPYEAVRLILKGGAECQAITWTFLGLSMPVWVLISASVLGVGGLAGNLMAGRER